MNKRELLMSAARAAGITGDYYIAYGEKAVNEGIDVGGAVVWNPLTNNADAFSLMVKLQMKVDTRQKQVFADICGQYKTSVYIHNDATDYEKYTRGAIVKCAALMGGFDPSIFNHWCPTGK